VSLEHSIRSLPEHALNDTLKNLMHTRFHILWKLNPYQSGYH